MALMAVDTSPGINYLFAPSTSTTADTVRRERGGGYENVTKEM
jgi:hypothetical protein